MAQSVFLYPNSIIVITNGSEVLYRSPESLSSFKVIPLLSFLLISALFMAEIFLYSYPDRTDILDEYQSADIELHNLSNRNEFRKGFKVGAQLVLEMIKPIK